LIVLIDSHCHIDDYTNLAEVLNNAADAGIDAILAIGIGEGPSSMQRALELAEAQAVGRPRIWATVGIHPQEAHQATPDALRDLERLAQQPRCLAVGEIGLDYYHIDNPDVELQRAAFVAQMRIAAAVGKPITIHCRTSELASPKVKTRFGQADAWEDLLGLIAEHWTPSGLPGIMHCFSGTQAQAERSLAAGFYLSFAGNLTYPRSTVLQEVAGWAPADRLLVETDAPFLAPQSRRGQQNEPAFMVETAAFLANLRQTTPEAIAAQTSANFHRLFPSTASAAVVHAS
jgi:TatD DNase family protein